MITKYSELLRTAFQAENAIYEVLKLPAKSEHTTKQIKEHRAKNLC